MRPRADTIPMFAPDPDQFQLTALIDAFIDLRDLADKWERAQLSRRTNPNSTHRPPAE